MIFNNRFELSIYHKLAFSGLGTSLFSFCSFNYNINTVKTLLHRAHVLASTYDLFHKQVLFLKGYFLDNSFTTQMFDNVIRNFFSKIYQPKGKFPTASKEVLYIKLPYLGDTSTKIKLNLLKNLVNF